MAEQNHMQVIFDAKSVNESLARMVVTAFMTDMNPTLEQVSDVKTAVSEAVTNAIIHGYENKEDSVELCCDRDGQQLDRKSTRLNSSHPLSSRMPSSA